MWFTVGCVYNDIWPDVNCMWFTVGYVCNGIWPDVIVCGLQSVMFAMVSGQM